VSVRGGRTRSAVTIFMHVPPKFRREANKDKITRSTPENCACLSNASTGRRHPLRRSSASGSESVHSLIILPELRIELPLVHRPNTRLRSLKFPQFGLSQTFPPGAGLPSYGQTGSNPPEEGTRLAALRIWPDQVAKSLLAADQSVNRVLPYVTRVSGPIFRFVLARSSPGAT